ncbi:hypothetical protein OHB14_36795 [Streptomyces sp. NBC_01613]|uniref:hypothetical protein n=1 Tax=Streptomyces sp. NBC_01613 TaxID=2975896 RepID=UPI00386E4C20
MPDPSTTRLGMYKSKSDGSEDVSYTTDIGQNLDKLDAAVGYQVVTSSTRPSSPYPGKPITESDTTYRTYFSNGTTPASASWVEIPNSSATFNNNLKLASGKQVNIGASGSTASLAAVLASATGDFILASRVTSDSVSRVTIRADGRLDWSTGAATADTNLYRSAANVLTTDDSLNVGINLSVAGSGAVTGNLAVTGGLSAGATTWTTYTPTVTNGGSVTWTTRTGYYYKIGKLVFVCIFLNSNAAGTGTGIVSVDMPSNVDRSTRQALTLHGETIGANGSASSSIRGGECVFFTGGTGATSDRLRVDNGTSNESNIQGADILANALITIQGWYREA